uniref:GRIP domain-containing protein n=1 Tax=Globisporangium ultimum (strain ATCC 200006 / CBS 805.95 / DAOM BR144) TaxID=431595 RepID=K3WBM7_GLOUD
SLKTLTEELRETTDNLHELQQQRDVQVESLKSRVIAYKNEINALNANIVETKQIHEVELQQRLTTQKEELALKITQLEESKMELTVVVQTKETQVQETLEKVRELQTRHQELEAKHCELESTHEAVSGNHETAFGEVEAELVAAKATIEELRAATATMEADRSDSILKVQREVESLKAQLEVEVEAANAARTALEVYKKRAHTALKKATSESKLNVRKATEGSAQLEQQVLDATLRVKSLEIELAETKSQLSEITATAELRIQKSLETLESEQKTRETTWQAELDKVQADLVDAQRVLQSKATLDAQITELTVSQEALRIEIDALKKELQSKSEAAREMLKVKDSEIAELSNQLQAALTAASATVSSPPSPVRTDNNSNNNASSKPPTPVKSKMGSPTSYGDDKARSTSPNPADDAAHAHIAAAVADTRSIPLVTTTTSSTTSAVDVQILKLAQTQALRDEEALKIKRQLITLEEQARLYQKQYEDTVALLETANRQKKRLQELSERNTEGVNVEYLKNVVIKYIESSNATEKERLIPVIATVLQFSPQEVRKVSQKLQDEAASSGLLGGVFSLFGGGGSTSPAPKPLASLSRQPSSGTVSGGPTGIRFDEPDDDDTMLTSLNPFAA